MTNYQIESWCLALSLVISLFLLTVFGYHRYFVISQPSVNFLSRRHFVRRFVSENSAICGFVFDCYFHLMLLFFSCASAFMIVYSWNVKELDLDFNPCNKFVKSVFVVLLPQPTTRRSSGPTTTVTLKQRTYWASRLTLK